MVAQDGEPKENQVWQTSIFLMGKQNKNREYQFFQGCKLFLSLRAIEAMIAFTVWGGKEKSGRTDSLYYFEQPIRRWPKKPLEQLLAAMNTVVEKVTEARDLIKIAVENYPLYESEGIAAIRELYKSKQ